MPIPLFAAALAASALLSPAAAPDDRRAELLRQRAAIDAELAALDTARAPVPASPAASATPSTDIIVTGHALALTRAPAGQTATTIDAAMIRATPAQTVADLVRLSPGVAFVGGNGPRDIGVSIRGSNARSGFGARNIRVYEDDFPVTQPDGLARFDLTDPHAYGAVDVVRGPSSARYGNYALEGALNFHTRSGRDIDGVDAGVDAGSDGYANVYATIGGAGARYDYAVFGSYVRGTGATAHNGYQTGTLNGLFTYALGDRDRITAKLIYNEGDVALSTRLSLAQYGINPYQRGCDHAATAAAGCGTIAVFVNGTNGTKVQQTAAEGDLARNDRRTITGLRYEHDLDADTTWRTQGVFDSRVVYQPTNATPFKGTLDSYDLSTDLTARGRLFGMDATRFVGLFYNYLDNQSYTFNKTPAGRNGLGALTQTVFGDVRNLGARARQEVQVTPALRAIAGIGAERSVIDVRQTAYTYPVGANAVTTVIPALRRFWNVAPEASVVWQADAAVALHARIGTGYGIPQSTSLFVTPAGVFGNNGALKAQSNIGIDVGAAVTIVPALSAEITGYQEWFRNELVTQSAGVNLQSYTANAPRSLHRGVEVGLNWRPRWGATLAATYSYNDQHYTDFAERLSAGAASQLFDRTGNAIPGVVVGFANVRAGYDRKTGALTGLGGFVEVGRRSRYYLDNANLLTVPGYTLTTLNLHYDPPGGRLAGLTLFASVQNLFAITYVGAASVISDGLNAATGAQNPASVLATTTGSIYAGQPRTIIAGVKGHFR